MSKTPCICIVDDHKEARQSLTDYLANEQYRFLTFGRGDDLLNYQGDPMPDVILLDVMMPGIDGFTVCARLKKMEQWQHIPVILVTALHDRKYMLRGLEAGAEEYLSKPVNGIELRARIRSMLRIKQQYDELQSALNLREKLANMTVHDLRQPINAALLRSSLIMHRQQLTPEDQKDLEIVRMQLRRVDSLANGILMTAKMDQGQFILERSPVDLKELIQKMQADYALLARVVKVELAVDLPQANRLCYVDANLVTRLIDNLINNAIKFAPANSQVTLRLDYPDTEEAQVKLQVIDQGPGIPKDYREEIFDEYRILIMREKKGPQVGLGLAFCRMVAEAHNGHIAVSANQPTGSIFTVCL